MISIRSARTDFSNFVHTENVVLQPGNNMIELTAKATRVGQWNFKQVKLNCFNLRIQMIHFLCIPHHFIPVVNFH